jgi:hypothetical protein
MEALSRRQLVECIALLAGASCVDVLDAAAQPSTPQDKKLFRLDQKLASDQLKRIYKPASGAVLAGAGKQHMLFYYDSTAKMLVNPFNVTPSLAAGAYTLDITLRNFHASQDDDQNIWSKVKTDAQMQINVGAEPASPSTGDQINWIISSGINVFGGGKSGIDQRLQTLTQNNKPTAQLKPTSKIDISNGKGLFQIQVFGQKKDSFWKKLLTLVTGVLNSPIFGTLPIPKLVPEAVTFASAVLDHLQGSDPLIEVLSSNPLDFKLYNGVTSAPPFTLRDGTWVTIDRAKVVGSLDANSNLPGYVVDLPGQFYELKDKNAKAIDANYAVLTLDLAKKS